MVATVTWADYAAIATVIFPAVGFGFLLGAVTVAAVHADRRRR